MTATTLQRQQHRTFLAEAERRCQVATLQLPVADTITAHLAGLRLPYPRDRQAL